MPSPIPLFIPPPLVHIFTVRALKAAVPGGPVTHTVLPDDAHKLTDAVKAGGSVVGITVGEPVMIDGEAGVSFEYHVVMP